MQDKLGEGVDVISGDSGTLPVSSLDAECAEQGEDGSAEPALASEADIGEDIPEGAKVVSDVRKRRRRQPKRDAAEQRLLGRRAMCKTICDIAPHMLKTVKLRVLGRYVQSTKGMSEADLQNCIVKEAKHLAKKERVLENLGIIDANVDRRNLKDIILFSILLQEETHGIEESKLDEKVIEYEKGIVKRSKSIDFFDPRKHEPLRWHHYDTYRIVLEAAWRRENDVTEDEAALLRVLRNHLKISSEEHWLIGAYLKRFPKAKCEIHSRDDIHEARKELQREGLLWSYRDENNRNIDIIPAEIVDVLRKDVTGLELQQVNFLRILQHDCITVKDLRDVLKKNGLLLTPSFRQAAG